MVHISTETPIQAERRLRKVIRDATLVIFDGAYSFHENPLKELSDGFGPPPLAYVRDDDCWSRLEPANSADAETFLVWRFHFTDGADNSGFVGWLAGHLKSKFGTGVFVTCGQNSDAGGIYDYWGAPMALADKIIAELRRLRGEETRSPATHADLNGVLLQVVENSPTSVIDRDTVFLFEQTGDTVRARYEGGSILSGTLDGILKDGVLEFAFSQIELPSTLATGTSKCRLRRLDGVLELVEDFTWSDDNRGTGTNILREI